MGVTCHPPGVRLETGCCTRLETGWGRERDYTHTARLLGDDDPGTVKTYGGGDLVRGSERAVELVVPVLPMGACHATGDGSGKSDGNSQRRYPRGCSGGDCQRTYPRRCFLETFYARK